VHEPTIGCRRAWMSLRGAVVLLAALGSANCASPLGPSEAGRPVPLDPGRVFVRVLDQAGAPVEGVYACIEISTVNASRVCGWTGPDGLTGPYTIAAGRRAVGVTLPPGFSAGPEGLIRTVDVVKDMSLTVEFTVRRH
jgi:hypothetical protein